MSGKVGSWSEKQRPDPCVCIHGCVCSFVLCVHEYMYICSCLYTYIHKYMRMTKLHVYKKYQHKGGTYYYYVYVHVYVYVYVYVYLYIYTCIYIYIYTYMYIYIYIFFFPFYVNSPGPIHLPKSSPEPDLSCPTWPNTSKSGDSPVSVSQLRMGERECTCIRVILWRRQYVCTSILSVFLFMFYTVQICKRIQYVYKK